MRKNMLCFFNNSSMDNFLCTGATLIPGKKNAVQKENIRNSLCFNLELHKLIGHSEAELFGITCCFGSCFQVQCGANQALSCFWEFPVLAMELH